jgi:hypothetical protein
MCAMADNTFKNWILGILSAVIIGVAVPVVVKRLNNNPAPKPAPEIISISGRVFDRNARRLIEDALVRLQVGAQKDQQNTDSEGRYAFSLADFDPRTAGSMLIEAAGYQPLTHNLSLQQMSDMQDQYLDAVISQPTATNPPPPVGGGPVKVHPGIATYVKRPDFRQLIAVKH